MISFMQLRCVDTLIAGNELKILLSFTVDPDIIIHPINPKTHSFITIFDPNKDENFKKIEFHCEP